jgi:site-specific DNA-cytosine methylase
MNVLIACEFSGIVRDFFTKEGHLAVSCDFLPSETKGLHYQGDVLDILDLPWDMLIAFPPCTHLAVSGARWFKDRQQEQKEALSFIRKLMECKIDKIAIENPIGVISTKIRKPDQIIQPWQFGHGETKATCLWLKNLPKLIPTDIVDGRIPRVHYESPGKDRWKNRSRTYTGIGKAMVEQWGQ